MTTEQTDTATAEETSTPDALPTPAGAAETEAPAEAPQSDATPAESEEAQVPTPEATPPSWASIAGKPYADAWEAIEDEAFQPVLERRDRSIVQRAVEQGRNEARQGFDAEQAAQVIERVGGNLGRVLDQLQDSNVDGAARLLDRVQELIQPYSKTHIDGLVEKEVKNSLNEAAGFFRGLFQTGLPLKAQHELEEFAAQQGSWEAVLKKRDELREPIIEARLEKQVRERMEKEAQAKQRQGTPPPVKPEGGAGGGTDLNKARRDYAEGRLSTAEAERLGIV